MSLLAIIPTYNEVENIGKMIDAVLSTNPSFHILVVDDNSQDGTRPLVKEKIKTYPDRLHLLERASKKGLGSAYIEGFRWALKKEYDFIVEMDADFSHPVEKLSEFYAILKSNQADVVIGSRYAKGGQIKNWPWSRRMISKMGSMYSRLLTGIPVRDTTAGFIGYRRDVLARMNLSYFSAQGYSFQIEIKLAVWKLGFTMKEIPIVFVDRVYGTSKMNSHIIKEAMMRIFKIALMLRMGTYTKKITL